ncbi:MAG TPA: nitronate monooxygenase [Patescibacteria group bacterium]|jgi:nitronate monooxygenase|nr:nitronate monooxygenase [Patescibacteria group bacterium]
MLKTRLTEVCGLTRPIVLAPLASGATSGHLASAVSEAGGLGLFGGIHAGGPEWVREQIRFTRSHTSQPFGVGFITVQIPKFAENFAVCLQERVPFLAFSFGDPTSYVAQAKAAGAKVLCQVQTLEAARLAVAAGTDVLVAQGNEAGGHTGRLGTLPFLAQVLDLAGTTPVIASGGIASGRALAAVLAAGGEGAWLGTPLLATHEAIEVSERYKKCIVESDGQDTVYTEVYDIMYDLKFPPGIAGRARINRITQEWHGRESEVRQHRAELAAANPNRPPIDRDPEVHPIWMGQSAGSVPGIRTVAEVIENICGGAERLLRERTRAVVVEPAGRGV